MNYNFFILYKDRKFLGRYNKGLAIDMRRMGTIIIFLGTLNFKGLINLSSLFDLF